MATHSLRNGAYLIIVSNGYDENGKQKIVHSQEQPEYKKEYLFETGTPFLCAKIFVIDDVTHSTMLFNYEY